MPDIKQLLISLGACPDDCWLVSQLKFNSVLFRCNPSRADNNLGKNSLDVQQTVCLLKLLEKGQSPEDVAKDVPVYDHVVQMSKLFNTTING
jgi:hypothetical protein